MVALFMVGTPQILLQCSLYYKVKHAHGQDREPRPNQPSCLRVLVRAMKGLAGGLLVSLVCWAPLVAQERDRSLERMSLALQQPLPIVRGGGEVESALPKTLGIFTLVPPTRPGEIIRVSVPIGELVSRAFKGAAAANRRRQEAAARRQVEAALEWFKKRQPSPK